MEGIRNVTFDTLASSDEDEWRAKISEQQAKKDQLFVTIRKKIPESNIIREIDDVLNTGADINALNSRGKTILDIAQRKRYARLEKYLTGRGGKVALAIENTNDDDSKNIEVNSPNTQHSSSKIDLTGSTNLQQNQPFIIENRRMLDGIFQNGTIHLTKDKLEELNIKLKSGFDSQEVKQALIRFGTDVNYQYSMNKASPVDIAWNYGYYEAVLMLLEADLKFPKDFEVNCDALFNNKNIPEKLKAFVRKRQELHEWIQNDELNKIQKFMAVHPLSNFFNCKNKSALETAAQFANTDTLAAVIAVKLPARDITMSLEQRKLLQHLDTEGNTLLSISAKCGKIDNVDFFISCGININNHNNFEESAVDLAWCNRHFDTVHMLLKADSSFPKEFYLDALNVTNAKVLSRFVEGRNNLHKLISENRLVEIKEFIVTDKSNLYLNSDGESALVTAVKSKRFEIYAFLKSKGITFKNKDEEKYVNNLPLEEKDALKFAMIREFPQIHKSHIFYLMSKSRSKKPVENFKERIENLYERLDDIPEVSIILQVLQYTEYLDVVFDFDNKNVMDINPTSLESTRGVTDYKDGRIYIAAGTGEAELAGTLAHELTHLAMYVLFKNDCNPFDKEGYFRQRFHDITHIIREKLKYIVNEISGYADNPMITLARAFHYQEHEHQSELIVRVPQILAQYSVAGRIFLVTCKEYKLLFDYYNDLEEGGLLHRCKEVIENNFLIKLRKSILFLNETVGKIGDMIKYGIHFKSCIDLNYFLKSKKQVFLIESGCTLLSMLNIYDSLIVKNKNYSLQNSFIIEFDSYIEKEDEFLQLLYSPAGKVLCISYSSASSEKQLSNALNTFKILLKLKPDKKIIFVIQESKTNISNEIMSLFKDNCVKKMQQKFTLNEFTPETRQKLMEREITLQKENIKLKKLIDLSDVNEQSIIDTNILIKLIKSEKIEIGCKPPDTSDLEGAYSQLFQEVEVNTFVNKLLKQKTREVYVISGISGSKKVDNFLNFVKNKIKDICILSEVDNLKSHIQFLDVQNVCRELTDIIQVTDDQFKAKHFKQICHNNSAMKIYWIHASSKEVDESIFILQQIYNPDFYVIGKRISREVVIEKRVIRELILSELSDSFIIIMKQKTDIQQWFQLNSEQKLQFKKEMQNKKITLVYLQDISEEYFPERVKANQTVHLLKFKEDHLIWYKTYGNLTALIKYRAKDYKNIEPLINEYDVTKIIRNNKVSIIAGDPGTGKSTIISRLCNTSFLSQCRQEESMFKSHWVIRVDLKDHVETIKNMRFSNSRLNEIAELLLQGDITRSEGSTHTFARGLISISLQKNNFKKPLLIAFDGFDEVLDETVRNKIKKIMQYLKHNTNAKFCVMTRLHYEKDLEGALSTFALRIEPMDSSTVRKFITKSFSNRLSLKLSKDKFIQWFDNNGKGMLKYIDAFLRKMQEVFKNDIVKFIGTPLQLYLMLENSIDSFLKWTEDNSKNPDFNFLGNDIWEVYENFVDKKYNYYCKTKSSKNDDKLHEEDIRNLDKYHKDLALPFIIKTEVKESLKSIKNIIMSVGIVKAEADHISFIHPTFAEYFAAKAFIYWITKWKEKSHSGFINFEKQKFFFSTILRASHYRVVRAFLNAKFLKEEFSMTELKMDYFDMFILSVATMENHVGIVKFVLDSFPNVDINDNRNDIRILHIASKWGYLKIVKLLIEKGAEVNDVEETGDTALYLAAKSGHLEIVKLLINEGAILNSINTKHRKALHAAVSYGHLDIVTHLVEKGADFNIAFENGYDTALTVAAQSGCLETVKWLLEKDADVNAPNKYGQTALHLASQSGHSKIVKLLINEGAETNISDLNNTTALHEAIKRGNLEIVTQLLNAGANLKTTVDNKHKTGLNIAVTRGHLDIIKLLIEKGENVNSVDHNGRTALYFAAESGYLEIADVLICEGANVNIIDHNNSTALFAAIKSNHLKIVKLLLDAGAHLNVVVENGYRTYLHKAVTWGQLEIITFVIKTGVNINAIDDDGRTALYIAAQSGYFEVVQLLLENGANVNISDHNDSTALHEAIEFGHFEIVELLLNIGADLNVAVEGGYETGLNRAARWGQLEIITLLIENKANVNAKDVRDCTALYLAAEFGHLNVVKLLIDRGANVNFVSNNNKTALFAAVSYGYLDIVTQLADLGADFYIAFENGYGTALTMSAQMGHLDIVKWLIEKESVVNAVDNYGQTALYLATESGSLEIVKFLIGKGACVNIVTKHNMTALYTALKYKQLEIVTLLLDNGADFNIAYENGYDTALNLAAVSGLLEIVQYLLVKGAKVNAVNVNGQTALHSAAEYGQTEIVKLLIDEGANVNMSDLNKRTALHEALEHWHTDVIAMLLNAGAYFNAAVGNSYETLLSRAAEWGQMEIIKLLMEKLADFDTVDHGGRTALYLAAQSGYIEIVKLLIKKGANVKIKDHNSSTALHEAIGYGHLEIVALLLDAGADLNITMKNGYVTGLNRAAKYGQLNIIKLLIEKGADVNALDMRGMTALYVATESGHLNVVKLLIDKGANVNTVIYYNRTALCPAVERGYFEIIKFLSDKGADFKVAFKNGYDTALDLCANSMNFETVKWLLENGANVNAADDGHTALYSAIQSKGLDIVKLLIDKGANVNVICNRNKTALSSAIRYGYSEITKLLVDNDADLQVLFENGYYTALILAAVSGDLETVKLILEKGAKVNFVNGNGRTALNVAAEFGNLEIVKLLIDKGANVHVLDLYNKTALHVAFECGYLEIVTLLLKTGADLDVALNNGFETALNVAASWGKVEIIKFILYKGVNLNATDVKGRTALYLAAKFGHLDIVKLLISEGASVHKISKCGATALYAAVSNRHIDIVKLLIDNGSDVNVARKYSYTALSIAARIGELDIVKLLIDNGADVDASASPENTALHSAVMAENLDIIKLLTQRGANVNALEDNGLTILHRAACFASLKTVKCLVENGANINALDINEQTALFIAVKCQRLEVAQYLLEKTDDLNIRDKNRMTVLQVALKCGCLQIVNWLQENRSNVVDKSGLVCSVAGNVGNLDKIMYLKNKERGDP